MKAYFIRHGEYNNPNKIMPFRMPGVSLSEKGRKQCRDVAKLLKDKPITKIFTSPIQRCVESAEIIAKELKLPVIEDNRITETLSPLQGMKLNDLNKLLQGRTLPINPEHRDFGGESDQDMFLRVKDFWDEMNKLYPKEEIIIVSHGDPIFYFVEYIQGNKPLVDKTSKTYKLKYPTKGGIIAVSGKKVEYAKAGI